MSLSMCVIVIIMWKEHTLLKIHHIYLIATHDQSRLSYENAIVSYASI